MATQLHRDADDWAALVTAWEASGLTTDAFAATIPGLSPRTLRSRIAKILGNADPHRAALRLAKENAQLWAEIALVADRCTCRAATESMLVASCRTATDPVAEAPCPIAMDAHPEMTCQAATPDLAPCADVPAAPIAPADVLDPAPEKQLAVEGAAASAASPSAPNDVTERPLKKGRAFWNFDTDD